jgi:hypothetical protein
VGRQPASPILQFRGVARGKLPPAGDEFRNRELYNSDVEHPGIQLSITDALA